MKLLGRLPSQRDEKGGDAAEGAVSQELVDDMLHWLVSRQTGYIHEDEGYAIDGNEDEDEEPEPFTPGWKVHGAYPALTGKPLEPEKESVEVNPAELLWAGFNGRPNKVADTCYAFWVVGSLGVSNPSQCN